MDRPQNKDYYSINNGQYSKEELKHALDQGYELAQQVKTKESDLTREINELKVLLDNKKAERKRLQSMRKLKLLLSGARKDRLMLLVGNNLNLTDAARQLKVEPSKLRQDLTVLTNYIQWKKKYDQW